MKLKSKIISLSSSLVVLLALMLLAGCDTKSPVAPESTRVTGLMASGTWKVQGVTIDGVVTNSFDAMSITFTNTAFTVINGGVIWPASGTWSFKNSDGKVFSCIGGATGIEATIDAITASSFTFSFTWAKTTLGGRNNSVQGKHVFSLKK